MPYSLWRGIARLHQLKLHAWQSALKHGERCDPLLDGERVELARLEIEDQVAFGVFDALASVRDEDVPEGPQHAEDLRERPAGETSGSGRCGEAWRTSKLTAVSPEIPSYAGSGYSGYGPGYGNFPFGRGLFAANLETVGTATVGGFGTTGFERFFFAWRDAAGIGVASPLRGKLDELCKAGSRSSSGRADSLRVRRCLRRRKCIATTYTKDIHSGSVMSERLTCLSKR